MKRYSSNAVRAEYDYNQELEPNLNIPATVLPATEKDNITGIVLLSGLLATLQVLDGVFTSIGISRFGLQIEGNPILRYLMAEFGANPTLFALKAFAILIVVALGVISREVKWVRGAIAAVSLVYVFAAVLPWVYILYINPMSF